MKLAKSADSLTGRRWRPLHALGEAAALYLVFIFFHFRHFLEIAAESSDDRTFVPVLSLSRSLKMPSKITVDPVDLLALQAIRKSLEDLPGSRFFGGWDFTADPCGFPGVFCDGWRVVALALGDPNAGLPGLTGWLNAAALDQLSALAQLSLVPGRVAGPVPDSLALCRDLCFLAFSKKREMGRAEREGARRRRRGRIVGSLGSCGRKMRDMVERRVSHIP